MRKPIHLLRWLLAVWIPLLLAAGCSSGQASKKLVRKTVARIAPEQRLELVSYKTKSVARSGEDDKEKLFFVIGDRKMLISFKADIKAGIDLKDFDPKRDITLKRREKSALIRLPEPVIFSCDVPTDSIVVEYQETGLFRSKIKSEEVAQVAVKGKENILQEIENQKRYPILSDARENARRTFTSLLNALGYEKVDVVFPSEESQQKSKVKRSKDTVGASGAEESTETESETEAVG